MPKESAVEQAARDAALVRAAIATIEIPLITLEACPEIVELCLEVGEIGLRASLSDAGTGAAMARAAASGAYQNICINLPGLADPVAGQALLARADTAWEKTKALAESAEVVFVGGLRSAAAPAT